eukprot:m.43160 g.43160  ORF g.43160 m.43160 type:complete len:69 (+) comp15045_c0_seq1:80-286(+)
MCPACVSAVVVSLQHPFTEAMRWVTVGCVFWQLSGLIGASDPTSFLVDGLRHSEVDNIRPTLTELNRT